MLRVEEGEVGLARETDPEAHEAAEDDARVGATRPTPAPLSRGDRADPGGEDRRDPVVGKGEDRGERRVVERPDSADRGVHHDR